MQSIHIAYWRSFPLFSYFHIQFIYHLKRWYDANIQIIIET